MRHHLERFKTFVAANERLLSATALFVGFVIDSFTLKRIDLLFENIVLLSYLTLAALCIAVLDLRETRLLAHRIGAWVVAVAPFVLQIVFGALFSAFVLFYVRSASLSASWPFILFLIAMLVGNESFRRRYHEQLPFRVGVFFVALLSYCIFVVPTLIGSIGVFPFILSITLALVILGLLMRGLIRIPGNHARGSLRQVRLIVGGIVGVIMLAYFTNIIPPIPLALKDAVVAHGVERGAGEYRLLVEPVPLWDRMRSRTTYTQRPGEGVVVWTSVFAPTDLSTTIVHEWQYRKDGDWVASSRIAFPIYGGADGGYRGYSTKQNIAPGAWRVSVETERGQVVGRVRFDVEPASQAPNLETIVR